MKTFWSLSLFAYVVLLNVIPASAQDTPKTIALIGGSDFSAKDILKKLNKGCPNVSVIDDVAKSDYTLEAAKSKRVLNKTFDLTLFDRDGRILVGASNDNLGDSVKDVCRAIKTSVIVEVVDSQTLTQSEDLRGVTKVSWARWLREEERTLTRHSYTSSSTVNTPCLTVSNVAPDAPPSAPASTTRR
jgi:hypothetical protein